METKRLIETLAQSRKSKDFVLEVINHIIDRSRSISSHAPEDKAGDIQKLCQLAEDFQQVRLAFNKQTADIMTQMQVYMHLIDTKEQDIQSQGEAAKSALYKSWAGVEDVSTLLQNFLFVLRHDVDLAFNIMAYLSADDFLLSEITTRLNDAQFQKFLEVFEHDQKRRDQLQDEDGESADG